MIRQIVDDAAGGAGQRRRPPLHAPGQALVYGEIESLINHFKLVMDGPVVPAGEVYVAHEGANGELGFYAVSTGSGTPYKVHVRAP